MSYRTNEDNTYAVGTIVAAKEHPSLQLQIRKYYQRIYYCTALGDKSNKQLVYFDRELMPPNS
jgi:hypothetical protein